MKLSTLLLFCLLSLPLTAQESASESEADEDYDQFFIDLEGITVTGTRTEKRLSDSPVVTESIGAEEIENSSAVTLTDVLDDYGLMVSSGVRHLRLITFVQRIHYFCLFD